MIMKFIRKLFPSCKHKLEIVGTPRIGGSNTYKCFWCGETYKTNKPIRSNK